MKNILIIAPLPPPINGQTKISQTVVEFIRKTPSCNLRVINFIKKSKKSGIDSFGRIVEVFLILIKIWKCRRNNDIIYLSLSESTAGNIKDLLTYFICYSSNNKMILHMLGGAGMKNILNSNSPIAKLNKYFHRRVKNIIVETETNRLMFTKGNEKVNCSIITNYVDDYLFVDGTIIKNKYSNLEKLNVLYLSNLLPGKGYIELMRGYKALGKEEQLKINLSFVGSFGSSEDKSEFLEEIATEQGIQYLGEFIGGEQKRELYSETHIFCLPTYYPYEGLPISILEAYASGIAVITTPHSGIPYVFNHNLNGYLVEPQSPSQICQALEYFLENSHKLADIGSNNLSMANESFRLSVFHSRLKAVLFEEA